MTERRMTTSISTNSIREFLRKNGLQLSSLDLTSLIEELSPESSRRVLSYALDFVRPFTRGMGLRVVRLSDTQVELILPDRAKNRSEARTLSEAAMITAGLEAVKIQWHRHAPLGDFHVMILEAKFKKHKNVAGATRVKMELPAPQREKALAELRRSRVFEAEHDVAFFDDNDQKVAELNVKVGLQWTPALNSSKDEKRGNS